MSSISPYSVRSALPRFEITSPGEALWFALRDLYLARGRSTFPSDELLDLTVWVEPSGGLAEYHADVTVTAGLFKLLKAAKRIEKDDGLIGNALYTDEGAELFRRGVSRFLVEQMGFAALDLGAHRLLPPLVLRCHVTARAQIGLRARLAVLEEAEESTIDGDINCYSCDSTLWSPSLKTPRTDIPLDHIWPRSLGGVSTFSNLLPICDACNGAKEDRASWSVFGVVQDYALAAKGGEAAVLLSIALHRRAAMKLAADSYVTIKEAYRVLGPMTAMSEIDPLAGGHFFNLSAHDQSKLNSLW